MGAVCAETIFKFPDNKNGTILPFRMYGLKKARSKTIISVEIFFTIISKFPFIIRKKEVTYTHTHTQIHRMTRRRTRIREKRENLDVFELEIEEIKREAIDEREEIVRGNRNRKLKRSLKHIQLEENLRDTFRLRVSRIARK